MKHVCRTVGWSCTWSIGRGGCVNQVTEARTGEKRRTLISALGLVLVVAIVAAPVAQATHHAVKISGKVKIADTTGGTLESTPVPDMGLLLAPGSEGALAVRQFAGGG